MLRHCKGSLFGEVLKVIRIIIEVHAAETPSRSPNDYIFVYRRFPPIPVLVPYKVIIMIFIIERQLIRPFELRR